MKRIEPILLAVFALVLVLFVYTLMKKPVSYAPTQTTPAVEDLNSELNSLDATDLDTGTDNQLEQLNSVSSSF